jgi:sugar lactone lactonase YvrE
MLRSRTALPLPRRGTQFSVERLEDRLAPSVLIPVTNRRDLVFDDARDLLYITTTNGRVVRYDPDIDQTLGPWQIVPNQGPLNGADITLDGKFLYAADDGATKVWKVDLATGVGKDLVYAGGAGSNGAWDVAIGKDGKALVTTRRLNAGAVDMARLDTATDTFAILGPRNQDTNLFRGQDRSAILIMEGNTSNNNVSTPVSIYDVATTSFSDSKPAVQRNGRLAAAVSRDGALFSVTVAGNQSIVNAQFKVVENVVRLDGGVVFDPLRNVLYGVDSVSDQLVAIDTQSWVEKYRLAIGENVPAFSTFDTGANGQMAVSGDGTMLYLTTPGGIRRFDLPQPSSVPEILSVIVPYPSVITAGTQSTITIQAKDGAGNVLTGYTGTVTVAASDSTATIPFPTYTFTAADKGTKAFPVTFHLTGVHAITIQDDLNGLVAIQKGISVAKAGSKINLVAMTGQRDLIFDDFRNQVIIPKDDGTVVRFDLKSQTVLTPWKVGSSLRGGDITVDGRYLYVADAIGGLTQSFFRKVDLATGVATKLTFASQPGAGSRDVVIPEARYALTSGGLGKIDLVTDSIVNGTGTGDLYRSFDRSTVLMVGTKFVSTGLTRFVTKTQLETTTATGAALLHAAALSRDGQVQTIEFQPSTQVRTVSDLRPDFTVLDSAIKIDGGVIHDPVRDVLYGIDTSAGQLVAFDPRTMVEKYRQDLLATPGLFQVYGNGTTAIKGDGTLVYLSTPTGILQIPTVQPDGKLATLFPTAPYPIFTTAGTENTITVTAKDAAGNVLTGYTGTVSITTSDPAATLSQTSYTFTAADQGTKTFTIALRSAGKHFVQVADDAAGILYSQENIGVNAFGLQPSIPVANRRDVAFDPNRNILYVSATDGFVYRFDFDTQTMLSPWKVAPQLNAIDVTQDGKFVYAADAIRGATEGFVRKIDADTGVVVNLPYDANNGSIGGLWDLVVTNAGHALAYPLPDNPVVITNPVIGIDLTTDNVGFSTVRLWPFANLVRSYKGNWVFISDADPQGTMSIYNPATAAIVNQFSFQAGIRTALTAAAPDGKLFAMANPTPVVFTNTFAVAQKLNAVTGGVWFDPANTQRMWVADTKSNKLVGFNTTNWTVFSQVPIGVTLTATGPFNNGIITGSADGRFVYVQVPNGIRQVDLFGQPGGLVISGLPTSMAAGTSADVTVRAVDPTTGQVLTNFVGLVRLISTDPRATLPADYFFTASDKGVKTFTVTFRTAGNQQLTAGTPSGSLASGKASTLVRPGPLARFELSGYPQGMFEGETHPFVVKPFDAFDNLIDNYTGKVAFSSSDPQAGLPAPYTFTLSDNGVKTFQATLRTVGIQSLTVVDAFDPTKFGTQTGIEVNPLPPPPGPRPPPPAPPPPRPRRRPHRRTSRRPSPRSPTSGCPPASPPGRSASPSPMTGPPRASWSSRSSAPTHC